MSMYKAFLVGLLTIAGTVQAQTPADSLREYDLEELVVSTSNTQGTFESVKVLGLAELTQTAPTAADAAISYLPSARIQTNSRGESLVYLRNSGERQVAVFLDGAPLNIAWDNRVDLSLVPMAAIGRLSLISGPSSVLLGTNVSGGAVELVSRLPVSGHSAEIDASVGSLGFRQGGIRYFGGVSKWRVAGTADFSERSALPIPGKAESLFSQTDDRRRTNTDWRIGSLHFRGQREFGDSFDVGLTAIGNWGKKGIAPESHIDPEENGVRFWRYPDTDRTMLIVSARQRSARWQTRSSLWMQRFSQTIAQYESAQYSILSASQDDVDASAGARIVTEYNAAFGKLRVLGLYTANRHTQTDTDPDGNNSAIKREFRQDVYSVGSELESKILPRTGIRLGASVDGYHAPGTGISGADGFDYSLSSGLSHQVSPYTTLRAGVARKVRFPTARESQDTGLGRFLLNADLKPETSFLFEAAMELSREGYSLSVAPFAQRTSDTIDQTRIIVDSTTFRQRINLDGSRVLGIEVLANVSFQSRVRLSGSITTMHSRGLDGDSETRLTERPNVLAVATAAFRILDSVVLSTEARHSGRAYGLAENGDLQALKKATMIDFKATHTLFLSRLNSAVQTYVRVENALDTVSIPQLGLPASGRFVRIGVSVTM